MFNADFYLCTRIYGVWAFVKLMNGAITPIGVRALARTLSNSGLLKTDCIARSVLIKYAGVKQWALIRPKTVTGKLDTCR